MAVIFRGEKVPKLMSEPYTVADYARALDSHEGRLGGFVGYQGVVASALRTASLVTAHGGVFEAAVAKSVRNYRFDEIGIDEAIEAIRAALTETTNV